MSYWKDKTIIAYIALAHHTRFITPVMSKLAAKGARIKYIVGQAERSQEITAIELGLSYAHIYNYLAPEDHNEIAATYSQMVNAFTGRLTQSYLLGILPVTVTDKTLFATAMEYIGFKRLMEKEKPDLCFALHELNRWGKMFAFRAKEAGVPFISLHEGLTYGLDFCYSGFAQYASLNLVWGERIKQKFTGYEAPGAKLIPTGNTHLSQEIAYQAEKKIRKIKRRAYKAGKATVALVIFSPVLPPPAVISPLLTTVSRSGHLKLFIKFHPASQKLKLEEWLSEIPAEIKANTVFIHGEESTYDLISMSDLVVLGHQSTTGLEAIAFGKPLIKLDFAYQPNAPYSFVDKGVATKMSAMQLAQALESQTDFSRLIDPGKVNAYLTHELAQTRNVVDKVIHIFKTALDARYKEIIPLTPADHAPELDWTLVVSVPDDPDIFLAVIEAISVNSEGGGTYDVLFLLPPEISDQLQTVLDSLKGDFRMIQAKTPGGTLEALNQALSTVRGKWILFLDRGVAPLKGWLEHLSSGIKAHAQTALFGGRISDRQGKIASAGMVVDANHTPVPAYRHLDISFAPAIKERAFQMVDHFLVVERDLCLALGGLTPEAGDYRLMDLCLKAAARQEPSAPVIYLPQVSLIFLSSAPSREDTRDAAYFFPRWTGVLWESESGLHKEDGVVPGDIDQERLAAAMKRIF